MSNKTINNITEAEIEANGKVMGDICCDNCDYATGYMDFKSTVFKVSMQGGYFMYDGEGGDENRCPMCKNDSLVITD